MGATICVGNSSLCFSLYGIKGIIVVKISVREIFLMNDKQEGGLAVAAAVLLLFSAMLDPIVTVILSVVFMLAFAVYKFVPRKKGPKESD